MLRNRISSAISDYIQIIPPPTLYFVLIYFQNVESISVANNGNALTSHKTVFATGLTCERKPSSTVYVHVDTK